MTDSRFIESNQREKVCATFPISQKDIDSINHAVEVLDLPHTSYADIIDYIKWTKYFLKKIKLVYDKNIELECHVNGCIVKEIEVNNDLNLVTVYNDPHIDDEDELDEYEYEDEDEDEYEDEDEDEDELGEHPNQYINQYHN